MIVNEVAHKEVKRGHTTKGKLIDHIYTNIRQKQEDVSVKSLAGSHHCLVQVSLRNRVKFQGQRQARIRSRRNYSKEKYLWELDKENWDFSGAGELTRSEKIAFLEESLSKFNGNVTRALNRIAPIKMKNLKANEEPWKDEEVLKNLIDEERHLWLAWKSDTENTSKEEDWKKTNILLKK